VYTRSRFISSLALSAIGLATASLPAHAAYTPKATIGISMPTITTQRWVTDGLAMVKALDHLGYRPELQFAEDDVAKQIAQIEVMMKNGAKLLVIAPIDGSKLAPTLQKAADQKIKVFSYDRLITGSPNVDFYATFDNYQVGVLQGTSIVSKLELDKGKGPFKIELFSGSPDDNNAIFFYDGAMSVLKPYLASGKLVVGSGQTDRLAVATKGWSGSVARARMMPLLAKFYAKDKLHAVLAPNDGVSTELQIELRKSGYGTADKPMPVITGQDADIGAVRAIIKGDQTSTIFKDTRALADVVAKMVDAILSGKQPEINDTKTYNNGLKVVPSYLLKPISVDISNWRATLVDSGYYKDQFSK
jgi:putative multiple sugar transport system substrate-binding protein